MSTTFEDQKASFTPIPATRNGISLTFALQEEKKGATVGNQYVYPDTSLTLEQLTTLIGADTCTRKLNQLFKSGMKEVYQDHLKANDGKLVVAKFQAAVEQYPFVSVSLKTLREEQIKLSDELVTLDIDSPEGLKSAKALLAKISGLKTAIASKERKAGAVDEDEDEDSVPATSAAQAAA